jgi:hypothetical protein
LGGGGVLPWEPWVLWIAGFPRGGRLGFPSPCPPPSARLYPTKTGPRLRWQNMAGLGHGLVAGRKATGSGAQQMPGSTNGCGGQSLDTETPTIAASSGGGAGRVAGCGARGRLPHR